MKTLSRAVASLAKRFPFVRRFADRISGMLTCFDRVIFKGHLPINHQKGLESFVDNRLRMRRKDFMKFAQTQSDKLVLHAQSMCQRAGRPYQFLKGRTRKESIVDNLLRQEPVTEGLVCVLVAMECCLGVRLLYGDGRPRLRPERRQQRVLYYYFLDPSFGLIHIRLQTWCPFTVQVYVNGHSWLARKLLKRRIGFVQHDNAFTELDDCRAAQQLADRFATVNWPKELNRLVRQVNPLMNEPWFADLSYYWVTDQAEIATDVMFQSRSKLAEIFPSLLQTASLFSPKDVLTYLGRRLHHRFDGEVVTDVKTDRLPGARIKHRMKNNWLKMYDKFSQLLRIETVINDPREFRVRRKCIRKGREVMAYAPMAKGVSHLRHYYRIAKAANLRYLDALTAVETPRVAGKELKPLTARKVIAGRSYAGFSPLDADDVAFFKAVLDGGHLVRGLRNADVRTQLFGATRDGALRRRQANLIGRKLKRLHVRGILAHIPRTRRWRVTSLGQQQLQAVIHLYEHGVPTFLAA